MFKKRKETHRKAVLFIIAKILKQQDPIIQKKKKRIFYGFIFSWVISTMEYYTETKKQNEYR